MYVCTYVRMYVCMYVCMYLCTYICMYACTYACTYASVYACMYSMHIRVITTLLQCGTRWCIRVACGGGIFFAQARQQVFFFAARHPLTWQMHGCRPPCSRRANVFSWLVTSVYVAGWVLALNICLMSKAHTLYTSASLWIVLSVRASCDEDDGDNDDDVIYGHTGACIFIHMNVR